MGMSSNFADGGSLVSEYRSFFVANYPRRNVGFIRGGTTGTASAVTDYVDGPTVITRALPSANLQTITAHPTYGVLTYESIETYTLGGYTTAASNVVTTCDKVSYSTHQSAVVGAMALSTARTGANALEHAGKAGYVIGGNSHGNFNTTFYTISDKVKYASRVTASDANTASPLARCIGTSCSQFESFGYILGGYVSGPTNTAAAYKTHFLAATTSAVSGANLTTPRRMAGGLSRIGTFFGNDSGYICAGYTTTYSVSIEKVDFVNDTTSAVSGSSFTTARFSPGAVSYLARGDMLGGGVSGGQTNTCETLYFDTETTKVQQPKANLSLARTGSGSCGAGVY